MLTAMNPETEGAAADLDISAAAPLLYGSAAQEPWAVVCTALYCCGVMPVTRLNCL